jgi:erythromycin esterase-like protein
VQIPLADVDRVATAIAGATSDAYDTGVSFSSAVMQIKVQAAVVDQVAKEKAITVTDAQREAFYATQELYPLLAKDPVAHDFMVSYANTATILSDQAAATAYSDLMAKVTVRVNPRFGVWDDKVGSLVDGSSGSLSEAAPAKG